MGTITYGASLVILFIVAAFIFGYFETPRRALTKGLSGLGKSVRKLRNIKVVTLNKRNNKSLTVGLPETNSSHKTNNSDNMRVYVHEY
jgi:hypothetical protein